MNRISSVFLSIIFIASSLNGMKNNFTITLLGTNKLLNPENTEITVKNYSDYTIPLVMPYKPGNTVFFEGEYNETPYIKTYKDRCKNLPELVCHNQHAVYTPIECTTRGNEVVPLYQTKLILDQNINQYILSIVTVNGTAVKLPLSEDEKLYALVKKGYKTYVQRFLDVEIDSEKSLLNYEPTKSFLEYLSSNTNQLSNITKIQSGFSSLDVGMQNDKLGAYKKIIVSLINQKFDRLSNN